MQIPGRLKGEREHRTERKAGTTCPSGLVPTASWRQPKGMENVHTTLSGLHELYMMRYVKMLPVYGASCAFAPPPQPTLSFASPDLPLRSTTAFVCVSFRQLAGSVRMSPEGCQDASVLGVS